MELARRYLGGLRRGIEIGGSAFNPFPGVRAWNLDLPGGDPFQRAQLALAGAVAPVDVWASAERLPVRSGSLDFLLASHVIEHVPDTIRTLGEWDRALAVGGLAFLIVPHRERTFDRVRPRTDLRHHLADFALGNDVASDPLVPTSHYHVWTTEDFLELVAYLSRQRYLEWTLEEVEEVDSKAGNGFTVVARKRAQPPPLTAAKAGSHGDRIAFHQLTLALPFQVVGRTLETIVPGPELPQRLELPRGLYRVAAIREGFPPLVARTFELALGEPAEPAVLTALVREGDELRFQGRHLAETTWLEARYPDGTVHRVLPVWRCGELVVDVSGLALPAEPFEVWAVNPPPAGGRGPALEVRP